MKLTDLKLICIKDVASGTWCAQPENELLKGIIVQVDNFEDIPKEIARSFELILKVGFRDKIHIIKEFDSNASDKKV